MVCEMNVVTRGQRIRTTLLGVAMVMTTMPSHVAGDAKSCADEIITLMQKDKHALGHRAVKMLRSYNSTCTSKNLCEFSFDEDTQNYLDMMTIDEEDLSPSLPENPIQGSATADFEGFSENPAFIDYVEYCIGVGAHVQFFNGEVLLKGTVMD